VSALTIYIVSSTPHIVRAYIYYKCTMINLQLLRSALTLSSAMPKSAFEYIIRIYIYLYIYNERPQRRIELDSTIDDFIIQIYIHMDIDECRYMYYNDDTVYRRSSTHIIVIRLIRDRGKNSGDYRYRYTTLLLFYMYTVPF